MKVDNRIVFGVIGAAVVAVFLWGRSCGVKSVIKTETIDTQYIKSDPITITVEKEKLKPVAVIKFLPGKVVRETVIVEKPLPEDTIGVYNDYFRSYAYSYQERLKYGLLTVEDTLSQNMFLGRSVSFVADSIPIVTKTILIQQPKKLILYATLSAMGRKNDLLYGAGAGLSLKGLNNKIYGVELKYLKGGSLYYEGKIMFPIRLKKKP